MNIADRCVNNYPGSDVIREVACFVCSIRRTWGHQMYIEWTVLSFNKFVFDFFYRGSITKIKFGATQALELGCSGENGK